MKMWVILTNRMKMRHLMINNDRLEKEAIEEKEKEEIRKKYI